MVTRKRDEDPVYPRVGGGNGRRDIGKRSELGLSPRGRGKPHKAEGAAQIAGSIPAWAGETGIEQRYIVVVRVYPRVGGGNAYANTYCICVYGLSPRGRGKLVECP